jgi:alpha-pyrone synthase
MTRAYINSIATAVPQHDVHRKFVEFAPSLLTSDYNRKLFRRMVERAQIEHRYSILEPHTDDAMLDAAGFYQRGAFPNTQARMRLYENHALGLACSALDALGVATMRETVTHLIITTCTGFYAPGIDMQIVDYYGLKPSVERTVIGFMGCYAGINALKLARHIVRSEPSSRVVIVNLELCTLHMQESSDLEQVLSFLLFADGCSASVISAQRAGIEIQGFQTTVTKDSREYITWHIGEQGFDMRLSGQVPVTIADGLPSHLPIMLQGIPGDEIAHWAVHPGGRTVLDAVGEGVGMPAERLQYSRDILRRFGNMSSATIMFVLKEILHHGAAGRGCAMAFGPGLTTESMLFERLQDNDCAES